MKYLKSINEGDINLNIIKKFNDMIDELDETEKNIKEIISDLTLYNKQLNDRKEVYRNHIKTYSESNMNESNRYNRHIQTQLDEILDKISLDGLNSLSDIERDFIKSFKSGKENETYKEFVKKVYQDGIFEFKLDHIDDQDSERKVLHGMLIINGKEFNGYITRMNSGMNDPQFNDSTGLTMWDHVDGFEYDLDNFIDNIVSDNE